jgi:hypothetical protein
MFQSLSRFLLSPFFILAIGLTLSAQNATVQLIHNAPDPSLATVEIWIDPFQGGSPAVYQLANGDPLVLNFRQATEFVSLPAGTHSVGLVPMGSNWAGRLATGSLSLTAGERVAAMAVGVVDTAAFAANPDGVSRAFRIQKMPVPAASSMSGGVEFVFFHGVPDAPARKLDGQDLANLQSLGNLVSSVKFADAAQNFTTGAARYVVNLTNPAGNDTIQNSYLALAGVVDQALVMYYSGFADTAANQNGRPARLWLALSNGFTLEAGIPTSRFQVIHNAPDPALTNVDVYLNNARVAQNVPYQGHSAYLRVPSHRNAKVDLTAANSSDNSSPLATFNYNLTFDSGYVAIFSGVLDPTEFAANPDGRTTAFGQIFLENTNYRTDSGFVNLLAVHGATDVAGVDLLVDGNPVANGLRYGDASGRLRLAAQGPINFVVQAAGSGTVVLNETVDLSSYARQSAIVLASGFADNTAANQADQPLRFIAFFGDGRKQIIGQPTTRPDMAHYAQWALGPNPSHTATTLFVEPVRTATAQLSVIDATGRSLWTQTLELTANRPARHSLPLDDLAPGTYWIRVQTGAVSETRPWVKLP